jgi:hypothetical protein
MDKAAFEKGLKIRREVLGPEHVDRSMVSANGFNQALQELVTAYCWGEVRGRPGLDVAMPFISGMPGFCLSRRVPLIKGNGCCRLSVECGP